MHAARQVASILILAALGLSSVPAVGAPALPGAKLSSPSQDPAAWALDLAGGAQATLDRAKDGTMTVTISTADSTDYHVALKQAPVSLVEGRVYTVRFRAKADQPRVIKLYSGTDYGDFHSVGLDTPVQLTSQWNDYVFFFKATGAEPKHVICPQFLLGSQVGTVSVAGVSLTLTPPGTLLPGTTTVPPSAGLVWQFRNFDPGVGSLRQDGTAQVVTTASTDGIGWHIQLNRLNSILREGQPVTVRFRARASAPTDMVVSGQVVGGDYHEIIKDNPEAVSTEWQNYSLVVTPHDIGGRPILFPQFFLGHMPGTVWIDGVTTSADTMTSSDSTTSDSAAGADGTSAANGAGTAHAPRMGLPPELPNAREIRLEGTIRETNFTDGSFVLLVTRAVQPNGTIQDISEPRPKTVRLSQLTRIGTGSDRLTNPGSVLQAGDTVAVIGRDLGVGKVLPARQILTLPRP